MPDHPEGARPAADADNLSAWLSSRARGVRVVNNLCPKAVMRAADLLHQQAARIETLESTIASRHGGEPLALLAELDEARERVEEQDARIATLEADRSIRDSIADGERIKRMGAEIAALTERAEKAERERDVKQAGWDRALELVGAETFRTTQAEQQRDALAAAIKWALGEEGEFPPPPSDHAGPYWWRKELRRRYLAAHAPAEQDGEDSDV